MNSHKKFSTNRGAPRARESSQQSLSLQTLPVKGGSAERGSDPYNTSGSFDRKNNWARVGKR